jgi:hypothetical protein
MSCCGKQRQNFQTSAGTPVRQELRNDQSRMPPRTWRSALDFEYTGQTGLTVVGPISGQRYQFSQPGAVVAVDVRDRRYILAVPNLKQL